MGAERGAVCATHPPRATLDTDPKREKILPMFFFEVPLNVYLKGILYIICLVFICSSEEKDAPLSTPERVWVMDLRKKTVTHSPPPSHTRLKSPYGGVSKGIPPHL